MVKLRVGGAGDHVPDLGEAGIGPERDRGPGEPQPDASTRAFVGVLDQGRQSAVVDQGAADRLETARALESPAAQQYAAAGGRGEGVELSERDYWICAQLAPKLKEMGLLFVGIDVIGDYLTEINVTSPTCIRELDREFKLDIVIDLLNMIEKKLNQ